MRVLQARSIAAIAAAAIVLASAVALSQTVPPTVIQVPSSGGQSGTADSAKKVLQAIFQVADQVKFTNDEGPITASLGDLLTTGGGAGLDKVRVSGRVRRVSAGGTAVGQIIWTTVSIDDSGDKRTAPLANPIRSAFPVKGATIEPGTRIKAEGDLDALLSAARSLAKKPADKKDTKDAKDTAKPAAAAPALATGGAASGNDVAKNFQPLQPVQQTAPAATPIPPSPNLTVTTDGCQPRVDQAAGFVVIQSQTLSNGQPSGSGCTDTAERIPIQTSASGCPDLVNGDTAQPQFKQFWVASNGTTNFLGDCQPDPNTTFPITTSTTACTAGPDLTSLDWVVNGEKVYTNHNNQVVVVSPCAPVSQTPLQTGKDFTVCTAQIDLTRGIVSPEFKSWFVNPVTQQQQDYTSCQPDPTTQVAVQKDYSACADLVGSTSAQRQVQNFYTDPSGARVNIGSCMADNTTNFPIQTTFAGCTDFVDQSKMIAEAQSQQFYLDAQGQTVTVKSCSPDGSSQFPIQADYKACPVIINQAAGMAQDVFRLYYMDRTNTRQNVGSCTPDPNRQYLIQKDFTTCSDQVDLTHLAAYAQYTTFYTDVSGTNHPVNQTCTPQTDAFPIQTDTAACPFQVNTSQMTAQEMGQLFYLNRLSVRVMVRDCAATSTPAVAVIQTGIGCSMRMDFGNNLAIQQKKFQYIKPDGTVVDATQCADSSETYAMTPVFGICPDLVLSDNSAAFKQDRLQISPPNGPEFVTECQPSQAPGDEATAQSTTVGCETTFFNYVDQMQSFGAWRFFYQFSGGPQVFLTQCEQDNALVYPMQTEIQGWVNNDPQKTAQPKTALFIMPPVGRVDVSAATVRAGAPNVAYTFQSETTSGNPAGDFYQGCEEFEPTNITETYLRPDQTIFAAVTGPGATVDLGDKCTRTTQSRQVYLGSTVTVFTIDPNTPSGPQYFFVGNYNFGAPGQFWGCADPAATGIMYDLMQPQTRVATTLPAGAGGTTSYSPWSNAGSAIQANVDNCGGTAPASGGGGNGGGGGAL